LIWVREEYVEFGGIEVEEEGGVRGEFGGGGTDD
jgi:hypothetical protein